MNSTYSTWQINEFVKLGGDQLVPHYADILGAILPCISDKEEKIRVVSSHFECYNAYLAVLSLRLNPFQSLLCLS